MASIKRLEIKAVLPVTGDVVTTADTIVKLKPALDALEEALKEIDPSATITSAIVSSNPNSKPRKKKTPAPLAAVAS